MIDLERARAIVKRWFPNNDPKVAYQYKDKYYLIMAPAYEDDDSDPFFIVDIDGGRCRQFSPLEDIDSFNKAIESGSIKTFKN